MSDIMIGLQQYDHDHYVPGKWETKQQNGDQHRQKESVKRQTPKLLSINPSEGKVGTMITVVLQDSTSQSVKLAFNSLVVDTNQLQQQDGKMMTTSLIATIPSFEMTLSPVHTVPISVCYFDNNDVILDTSLVAHFTYLLDDGFKTRDTQNQQTPKSEKKRPYSYLEDDYYAPASNKRAYQETVQNQSSYDPSIVSSYSTYLQQRSDSQNDTHSTLSHSLKSQQRSLPCHLPPPTETKIPSPSSTSVQGRKHNRRASIQSLKSTSHQTSTPVANYQPYPGIINQRNFDLVTDLDTMMENWTVAERVQGRRLVQFWRDDGLDNVIQCGCQPVSQNDAAATDVNNTVVSCIYWPEKDDYYITSVDAIYLLESMMKIHFGVEEKNRIRRNLEGFRPMTVAKCKPISAEFFRRVMSFPHPKPRNIEKDIKAFTWKILPYALKKIITKYAIAASTASTSQQQQPSYQNNDTLPLPSSSMFLSPTSFGSSISPDSMTSSLSSASSLAPLPTPPSIRDDHHEQQHQHSYMSNKQQLYYNPTTMTYGYHQEPGVRTAQPSELGQCLQPTSLPMTASSPPISSNAPPSPPILLCSEPVLSDEMTSFISAAPSNGTSLPISLPTTTTSMYPYSTSATLGNSDAFHDTVSSMSALTSLPLSNQSTSTKYMPQLFIDENSPLV